MQKADNTVKPASRKSNHRLMGKIQSLLHSKWPNMTIFIKHRAEHGFALTIGTESVDLLFEKAVN
uniref:Uncharacterized protein n=1 Tax=Rhizophora mucronata TaxID=61149 RepID=A0A2P2MVR6_RHIMU